MIPFKGTIRRRGYTWNLFIYAGKDKKDVSTSVVLNLAEDLGWVGVCITENWYKSLQLAHILLDRKMHSLGTFQSNRKGNPIKAVQKS